MTVDTTGRAGWMAKHVTVYSNDPVSPMVSLTVLVEVIGASEAPTAH